METINSPSKKPLTRAIHRVLGKAHKQGRIFAADGFDPVKNGTIPDLMQTDVETSIPISRDKRTVIDDPQFDTSANVLRCLREGYLTFGNGYNTYVLTEKGQASLSEEVVA